MPAIDPAGWGIELELAALFILAALGASLFDRFETEIAAWRKLARWALAAALTLGPYPWIGHWSLVLLAAFAGLGAMVHYAWCAKHGIDPLTAEPRRKYYELRGWRWPQ